MGKYTKEIIIGVLLCLLFLNVVYPDPSLSRPPEIDKDHNCVEIKVDGAPMRVCRGLAPPAK